MGADRSVIRQRQVRRISQLVAKRVTNDRGNFDTRVWHMSHLVVGVFDDDMPGAQIDVIETKGLPAGTSGPQSNVSSADNIS